MHSERLKKYLLILLGSLVWSVTMVKSGLVYAYGMGFWGPNGHDGIWHISLINSLSAGSLNMPIFSGEIIKNYHIGFDLILAAIHFLTRIPAVNLYFQIIPPLLALAVGWLTYEFVFMWKKSKNVALWAVFFTYFGGSLGWIFNRGESLFWAQQSISSLVNPPYALSLVILLSGLIFLQKNKIIPGIILFALLPQIKIYAGILALAGLLISGVFNRKNLIVFLASSILAMIFYLPLNSLSTGLLVFKPFWFLDTLFAPDRLNWPKYFSALNTYSLGKIWFKAIPAYFIALLIFLVGNLSLRIIGLLALLKFRSHSWIDWFIGVVVVGGITAPMLFIQKGTSWNTIQFFYYAQFFLGILLAVITDKVLSSKSQAIKILVSSSILIFTLPTTFDTLKHYLPSRPPAKISLEEMQALNFLSQKPPGVVLTYPFDKEAAGKAESNPPRPLSLYETTAYVSAFTGKPVYLEDEVNLSITGYLWESRRLNSLEFFSQTDENLARGFLTDNHIRYIYLSDTREQKPVLNPSQLHFNPIYEFSNISIWAAGQ